MFSAQKKGPLKYIAIDLGTTNTIAYVSGRGIIFNEPSTMAFDLKNGRVMAIGKEAQRLVGKTHDQIEIVKPLNGGGITDLELTQQFIQEIFTKANVGDVWKDAIVLIACPKSVTQLERDAMVKMCYNLGAKYVQVEEDSLIAALGADIDIYEPKGTFILDIGGGKSSCAIISAGGIVISKSIRIGGDYMNEEIMKYIRARHTISIGIPTAEQLKKQVGSLFKSKETKKMIIFGRDIVTGMPKEAEINDAEIRKLLISIFTSITQLITEVLENTPSELAGDAVMNGLIITGGGALMEGIKNYTEDFFQIPVRIAKEPQMAVINGAIGYEKFIRAANDQKKIS